MKAVVVLMKNDGTVVMCSHGSPSSISLHLDQVLYCGHIGQRDSDASSPDLYDAIDDFFARDTK